METATQDKLANAKASAKATYENIKELVETLTEARDIDADGFGADRIDEAEQAIHEHPLSVEIRSGWYGVSGGSESGKEPAEYRILISTGGPAVQITGELDEYAEPKTATLQCQDWFLPWADVSWSDLRTRLSWGEVNEILLAYARCFYFGE